MIYRNKNHQPFHFPSDSFYMKMEFRRQPIDLYHEHHKTLVDKKNVIQQWTH
jgi:hypothetical protein